MESMALTNKESKMFLTKNCTQANIIKKVANAIKIKSTILIILNFDILILLPIKHNQ